MDDDRLQARFRSIEAPVTPAPEFVDDLHGLLAARLGLTGEAAPTDPIDAPQATLTRVAGVRVGARRPGSVRTSVAIAASLALAVGVVIGGGLVGSLVERPAYSVLSTIRTTGTITVAVRPDAPQTSAPGGTFDGFDVDVAKAIAARLGVREQLLVLNADDMRAAPAPDWQIAFPSGASAPLPAGVALTTDPYYAWPIYVVVAAGAPPTIDSVAALRDSKICVAVGGAAEAWLQGTGSGLVALVAPPAAPTIRTEVDDATCFGDLASGTIQAVATSGSLEADLAERSGIRIIGGPSALEPRTILVAGDEDSAGTLRDAIDAELASLRADGSLARLSEARFGGQDLSGLVP